MHRASVIEKKILFYVVTFILGFIFILSMFYSCSRNVKKPINSLNNINNSPIIKMREDTQNYFFSNDNDNGHLYKLNKDNKKLVKLFDGEVSAITITENEVFFRHNPTGKLIDGTIYSITKDGKNLTKYVNNCDRIYGIKDNIIYYASIVPMFYLYSYDIKEKEVHQLTDYEIQYLTITKNAAYFMKYGENCEIIKTTDDLLFKTTEKIYGSISSVNYVYANEKLYFIDMTENEVDNTIIQYSIKCYNPETNEILLIMELPENITGFPDLYVKESSIYYTYCNYDSSEISQSFLYCYREDIEENILVTSDQIFELVWFGENVIFYSNNSFIEDDSYMGIMDYNGKNLFSLI